MLAELKACSPTMWITRPTELQKKLRIRDLGPRPSWEGLVEFLARPPLNLRRQPATFQSRKPGCLRRLAARMLACCARRAQRWRFATEGAQACAELAFWSSFASKTSGDEKKAPFLSSPLLCCVLLAQCRECRGAMRRGRGRALQRDPSTRRELFGDGSRAQIARASARQPFDQPG